MALERRRAIQANADIIAGVTRELGFSMVTVPGAYWEIAPGEPAYYWVPEDVRIAQVQALRKAVGEDILLVSSSGGVMAMPGAADIWTFRTGCTMRRSRSTSRHARRSHGACRMQSNSGMQA